MIMGNKPAYPVYNTEADEGLRPFDPQQARAPMDCAGAGSLPLPLLTGIPTASLFGEAIGVQRHYRVRWSTGSSWERVYTVSDNGIIGQAYGRKIHAREVVAVDEAGDGLCWVRLTRFGDDWLLIRSDARDVSRAVRKLRQIPPGEQSDRFPEVGP